MRKKVTNLRDFKKKDPQLAQLEVELVAKQRQTVRGFLEQGDILVQPCLSTVLVGYGYNRKTHVLGVMMKGGRMYFYHGVPWEVYGGLVLADSKGEYFNRSVKGKYPEEKSEV